MPHMDRDSLYYQYSKFIMMNFLETLNFLTKKYTHLDDVIKEHGHATSILYAEDGFCKNNIKFSKFKKTKKLGE